MKLTILCADLARVVSHVRGIAGDGKLIPILGNVLLEATADHKLTVTSTDLSLQVRETVDCTVLEPGATTISASRLNDALRTSPSTAEVTISLPDKETRMVLQIGRSRFQLPVLSANSFSVLKTFGGEATARLDTDELTRLLDKTQFAAASGTDRPWLCGVFVHTAIVAGQNYLCFAATDGHRLAVAEMEAPASFEFTQGVVVPIRTLKEVRRLLDDAGETVEIALDGSRAMFDLGGPKIVSKVLGSQFVDYKMLIPGDHPHSLKVENALLTGALKRSMVVLDDKARSVRFGIGDSRLTLTATDQNASEVVEEVDADVAGDDLEMRFNAGYILDITSRSAGEQVEVRYVDAKAAVLITDPADRHSRFVIMPQFT